MELVSAGLLAAPVDNENVQFIKGHWHNCDPLIKHQQFEHQSLTARLIGRGSGYTKKAAT
jgi:hypothetical protein